MSSKAALQEYLDMEKARFIDLYGGEVVRYASPEGVQRTTAKGHGKRTKAKVGVSFPALVKGNNLEEAYIAFVGEVEKGEYKPPVDPEFVPFKDSRRKRERVVLSSASATLPELTASQKAKAQAESWFR